MTAAEPGFSTARRLTFTHRSMTFTAAPFAITTPLYYVNDLPHIGSAYTTIAADVVARFHRLTGRPVLMITGTDEHGQKILRTAEERGVSPQDHCDQVVTGFESLWQKLNIQWDRFIRTTSPRHEVIVREFFQRVWDKGDIYQGQQQGWYCVSCEEFKEERDLLDDHRCPLHPNKTVEWRDEQNYFFRLSNYQEKLEQLYAEQPDFIQPETRRNEVLSFVKRGLQDFSISRVNLDWGFPVPTDPNHTHTRQRRYPQLHNRVENRDPPAEQRPRLRLINPRRQRRRPRPLAPHPISKRTVPAHDRPLRGRAQVLVPAHARQA